MCSPCGPMVCYKYEDCGPPKAKTANESTRAEEGGSEKRDEKENQLKRTKSRELRGGIMYYSCHCIKRNGLQHDCRRTGCGGESACLVLPDPVCAPSQLARARGLADPAALEAHLQRQAGGGSTGAAGPGSGSGKRFIVCELKGITTSDGGQEKAGKCCKCPSSSAPVSGYGVKYEFPTIAKTSTPASVKCPCPSSQKPKEKIFEFDEKTIESIFRKFETQDVVNKTGTVGPGGRIRQPKEAVVKEPCTRPGCVHWKPPPPCMWDGPCKADCFEAHPGIQPGRNPLTGGGKTVGDTGGQDTFLKMLTPYPVK